jgi:hypothetical protein
VRGDVAQAGARTLRVRGGAGGAAPLCGPRRGRGGRGWEPRPCRRLVASRSSRGPLAVTADPSGAPSDGDAPGASTLTRMERLTQPHARRPRVGEWQPTAARPGTRSPVRWLPAAAGAIRMLAAGFPVRAQQHDQHGDNERYGAPVQDREQDDHLGVHRTAHSAFPCPSSQRESVLARSCEPWRSKSARSEHAAGMASGPPRASTARRTLTASASVTWGAPRHKRACQLRAARAKPAGWSSSTVRQRIRPAASDEHRSGGAEAGGPEAALTSWPDGSRQRSWR